MNKIKNTIAAGVIIASTLIGYNYSRPENYQETIKRVKTPRQAQEYINKNLMNRLTDQRDEFLPFKLVHESKEKFDCKTVALTAYILLNDDNYNLQFLKISPYPIVYGEDKPAHLLILYEENNKFGTIGFNSDYTPAKYDTLEDLMKRFEQTSRVDKKPPKYYKTEKIITIPKYWIHGDKPF